MTHPEGTEIQTVQPGSIADDLGLVPGDRLLSIDGETIRDLLDYRFLSDQEELVLLVRHLDGSLTEFELEKDEEEDLGIHLEPLRFRRCGSRCVFCFIDQNPPGLRESLYLKDEDYRLSFLHGNYVSLDRARPEDLERILRQRLSPLYVSIHATDPQVRGRLLGWNRPAPILPLLERILRGGIQVHGQVVLCPGWNDGEHLDRTVRELAKLDPPLSSVAVVPVGLTKHRIGLPGIEQPSPDWLRGVVAQLEPIRGRLRAERGEALVYPADEFYLTGGLPLPPVEDYREGPQRANGVGLAARWHRDLAELEPQATSPVDALALTGRLAEPLLQEASRRIRALGGGELEVRGVSNGLYGDSVTVAGLLGGRDLAGALGASGDSRPVLIPEVMLKVDEPLFLDGWSLEDLRRATGRELRVCPPTVSGLVQGMVGTSL